MMETAEGLAAGEAAVAHGGEVDRLRRSISAMRGLADAARELPPDHDVLPLLDEAVNALMLAVDAKDGSLLVKDEESGDLVFVVAHGDVAPTRLLWRRVPRDRGIAAWVARNGCAAIVNDTDFDERFCPWFDQELEFETQSVIAGPLLDRGEVLGVIEALNKRGGKRFNTDDQEVLSVFCHLAGQVLSLLTDQLRTSVAPVGVE